MAISDYIGAAALAELVATGDGVEVTPCASTGYDSAEPCEGADADMWSVYIHRTGHGVQCVGDFMVDDEHDGETAEGAAYVYARGLVDAYPQLGRYGVNCGNAGLPFLRGVSVGMGELRHADENGRDATRPAPQWNIVDLVGAVVAEVYEVTPGSFECWRDGELIECTSVEDARAKVERAGR